MPADRFVVRALSMHAGYACRQTGVCCASNWPVPVEIEVVGRLQAALVAGELTPAVGASAAAVRHVPGPPGAPAHLLARAGRQCVFLDSPASCRVHSTLGHAALPLSCRQFPRVTVRDPRGVSLTLSHYCPTAAAMLDDDAPVRIVEGPAGFPADAEYDGLDAARAMPPLLRPDMLMDWEAWWDIEARAVELLSREPADVALGRLRLAVEAIRPWAPAHGTLGGLVRTSFDRAQATDVRPFAPSADEIRLRTDEVVAATPSPVADEHAATLDPANGPGAPDPAVLSRYLAAHAFANWQIQLGQGLRTWLRSIETASVLASALGVRTSDLWLRHLADPARMAKNG